MTSEERMIRVKRDDVSPPTWIIGSPYMAIMRKKWDDLEPAPPKNYRPMCCTDKECRCLSMECTNPRHPPGLDGIGIDSERITITCQHCPYLKRD